MAVMAHSSQHEEDLVRRVQRGDAGAFDRLVDAYAPRVYSLAYRLVGNPDDANDMAQEAFVRVYRALPGFKGGSAFSTWLYRIVTNVCYNELKRRRRRPPTITDLQRDDGTGFSAEDIPDDRGPEDAVMQRERRLAIQQAIVTLPEHFRMMVVLYDLQGLSYQEIADVLRTNVGTVKSRLNRGRNLLREKLAEDRELFAVTDGRST